MKRRFTILTAAFALLAILAIPMGMWGQTEVVAYTLDGTITGGDNGYATESTITQNSVDWKVTGNTTLSPWRLGGKSLDGVDRPIYSTSAFSDNITKVVVTTGTTNATSVNAVKLVVSSSSNFTSATTLTENWVASSEITFNRPAGTDWSNMYFKIIYNISVSGTSNKYAEFKKAEFYKESTGPAPTTYTVTFNAGDGTFVGNTNFPNASNTVAAGTYTLPSATPATGYTFDGWTATGISTPITGSYTVSSNIEFTAQYTQNSGSGTVTATLTQSNLELTGSYSSNTSITIDGITYVHTDLMKNNSNIQAKASTGTIKNTTAYPGDITSVAITHSGTARATTINGSADGTNWTQVATGSGSITADFSGRGYKYFQITRGSNAAYWEKIDITYSTTSSSLTDSDLAITNASTDLAFDLYNNTTAQVINYTTSSTGAITITPAESDYFSYVHDATAKTVTVTPMAVTPSAQTITISQEADDDYYAGSASFTVSIANSDPNVPGTVNNPYTVAQAIANTPSNGNVYIQGIVSSFYNTSIVGDGSNYRYYISDDGTTTTQLLVYKGKGLNQATFTNADDLLVGDEVVIYGTLITYQSAPEVASGNYLYSWNRPVAAVEAPTFSPAAGTFTTTQTVTLSCATTGATIYYTLDGTEPTDSSTEYTNAIAVSTTTTIKAIAYVGSEASTVATATYHINSQDNPYTVAQALAFNEYPANGIYVHGIVSTAPTQNPTSNGELTYHISVDGEAANQLEVYKGKGLNEAEFEAQDDIQVGDIVTIYGNVVIYNGTKEFAQGNYLVSFERPAQQYTLTVTCSENVDIFTFVDPNEQGVEGATTQQVTSGTEVGISVSVPEGYVLTLMVDGENVTSDLDDTGYYTFSMPAHAVTVTATASVAPVVTTNTYTLATSIESGKTYIIVGESNYDYYAMGNDKGNNRYAYEITLNGTIATATIAEGNYVHEFTISSLATAGFYSICDAITPGYLYAASSGDNYLKTETTLDGNHNGDWEITFNTDGSASIIASNSEFERNIMRFNNSSHLFSCYKTGQHPVYLYVKDETPTTEYEKTITGYGTGTGNWYLIASPVGQVAPSAVTGMLSDNYDLFIFDQAAADGKEWRNCKPIANTFKLEAGKGYLYASKEDTQLVFTGKPYSGDGTVTLTKTNDATTVDFPGWNLVGNPFSVTAYLPAGRAYYTMHNNGEDLLLADNPANSVEAMEGVFVIAEEDGEELQFTTSPTGGKSSRLGLNLSNGRNVIDRVIVRFGEGQQLPKFQLNKNHTKVYIPVDGKDYAVVRGEEMGEMPVNFKVENNGTYTFSFSSQNAEFAYLHLIDNLTGTDVDMLQSPSYSFEAKTTDYESRFKLVFATGNSDSETFAYYSNGSFVINNEGNATLQVIDVTGRIVKCESVTGCANVNVNAAPGVYMLRLVNGTDVKTQKVVVK